MNTNASARSRYCCLAPAAWLIGAFSLAACSSDARENGPAAAAGDNAGAGARNNGGAAGAADSGGSAGAGVSGAGAGGAGVSGAAASGAGGAGTSGSGAGGAEMSGAGAGGMTNAAGAAQGGSGGSGGAMGTGTGKYAGMTSIFDGATLTGWVSSQPGLWTVMNGALHGNGTARGYLYTTNDYQDFRVVLSVRHLQSTNDHQPCVLIWGKRPPPALDALGAIQFQVPNGGSWDYRPGKNNAGDGLFTHFTHPRLDASQWHQCEILAHATGKARMACCPLGTASTCKGQEYLDFNDPTATQKGPLALQVHNAGLHDEYKDIFVQTNPTVDDLVTLNW